MEAGAHNSSSMWMHSPIQKFSRPLHPGILWRFHYVGIINEVIGHWSLTQSPTCLLSLEVCGEAAMSNPFITWLVPLATSPHPEAIQGLPATSQLININSCVIERCLLWIKKDIPLTTTQEILSVLDALYQEVRMKTEYIFLVISKYHSGIWLKSDQSLYSMSLASVIGSATQGGPIRILPGTILLKMPQKAISFHTAKWISNMFY